MWKSSKHRLLAAMALCGGALTAQADSFTQVKSLYAEASRGGRYVASEADELRRAEALFLRLAKGAKVADAIAEAQALGLDITADGALTIVRERDDAKRGRGFFIFRSGAHPDVLQVPHARTDEMTEDIGMALFREGSFSAGVWNTVPRHYQEKGLRVDADMAHLPNSYFSAFARAAAQAFPSGQTIQIHGFDQGKRKSNVGAGADMILSSGTRLPTANLRNRWTCLKTKLNRPIALYPETIGELGATTNVQGDHLRRLDYPHFIHVEMSYEMRRAMRDDADVRAAFLACFQS